MRVLFAIDGSHCSRAAVRATDTMTFPIGTEIRVISVVDLAEPLPSIEQARKYELQATKTLVESAVEELKRTHPNAEVTGELIDGYAVDEILRISREWIADIILVGSHGRTGVAEFLLGSVSRAVLLHAPCAVRIVREPPPAFESQPDAHRVLICLDQSEHSTHLLDHVLAWPWGEGTKFKCVFVLRHLDDAYFLDPQSGFAIPTPEHYKEMMAGHQKWIDNAAKKINDKFGVSVATGEVLLGEPREHILDAAEKWPADIIMLGSHGRRGIDKLMMGSVSEAVAMHAHCSVEISRIPAFRQRKMHVIV